MLVLRMIYIGDILNIEQRAQKVLPRNISAITCSIFRSTVVLMMQLPEKEIKAWRREKKDVLIAASNPSKKDLAEEFGWL